jgi:hypothetical protein
MKKTILLTASLVGLAMVVMGFEGGPSKKILTVERVGVGNWRTTMYINANQVVAFEQAQPNMDGANTKIYFGPPSRGSDDKTVVMGVSNDFNEFKQQMEEALQ